MKTKRNTLIKKKTRQVVRRFIRPKAYKSEGSIVRKFCSSKVHESEGSLNVSREISLNNLLGINSIQEVFIAYM